MKTAGSAGRFLLTLDGTCYSEPVRVQTPTGVDRRQRMASNPDLLVEVRDGKIHGLQVRLNAD